jgi:hypothetical protein
MAIGMATLVPSASNVTTDQANPKVCLASAGSAFGLVRSGRFIELWFGVATNGTPRVAPIRQTVAVKSVWTGLRHQACSVWTITPLLSIFLLVGQEKLCLIDWLTLKHPFFPGKPDKLVIREQNVLRGLEEEVQEMWMEVLRRTWTERIVWMPYGKSRVPGLNCARIEPWNIFSFPSMTSVVEGGYILVNAKKVCRWTRSQSAWQLGYCEI